MELQDLQKIEEKLNQEFKAAIKKARIQYVKSINPFKKGDIIETSYGDRILIDRMSLYDYTEPSIIFSGRKLTRKNTPFKNNDRASIYLFNQPKLIKEGDEFFNTEIYNII